MAQLKPFSNLTNIFFSISPNQYEYNFKEEIWGCYKYIGIPLETIYAMPIQERKYYIQRHNLEQKKEEEAMKQAENANNSSPNDTTISGEMLNAFAKKEQQKK